MKTQYRQLINEIALAASMVLDEQSRRFGSDRSLYSDSFWDTVSLLDAAETAVDESRQVELVVALREYGSTVLPNTDDFKESIAYVNSPTSGSLCVFILEVGHINKCHRKEYAQITSWIKGGTKPEEEPAPSFEPPRAI